MKWFANWVQSMRPAPSSPPSPPSPASHSMTAAPHDAVATADHVPDALSFSHVSVSYRVDGHDAGVLHDLSLRIRPGEAYGLVGESGCGKSTAALAAVRYLPRGGKLTHGQIHIVGQPLATLDATALRHLRGHRVSMVYQDAGSALNPSMTVGRQLIEAFQIAHAERGASGEKRTGGLGDAGRAGGHRGESGGSDTPRAHDARPDLSGEAEAMLRRVRIDRPSAVMRLYPHQLSGGMQQRIVIAMALASRPALLILDEPTTGLDSTVEAEVLALLRDIREADALAMLFISHDLAVVASICDRVGILYAGALIEEGSTEQVLRTPRHPYTIGLLRCLPAGRARADGVELRTIPGAPPPLGARTDACAFADRCELARPACVAAAPPLYDVDVDPGHGRADPHPPPHASLPTAPTPRHVSRCYFHQEAGALPIDMPSSTGETDGPISTPAAHDTPLAAPAAAQMAGTDGTPRDVTALTERTDAIGATDAVDATDTINAIGAIDAIDATDAPLPKLRVTGISKTFHLDERPTKALDDVSFALYAGQTLGLVGESGSGKSTLARVMLGLETPDHGTIELDGHALPPRVTQRSPEQIRAMQIVFQRPDAALNRAWSVQRLIARAIHKLTPVRSSTSPPPTKSPTTPAQSEKSFSDTRLHDLLAAVRLAPRFLQARTATLSGGLKQRVAIASAFAGEPQIVICDEPTSALDVSVQAAILNLLTDLQRRQGVSYLFISHDLEVIRYLADQIAVLYRGRIVEIGPAAQVLSGPNHPYTAQLVAAAATHVLPSTTAVATAKTTTAAAAATTATPPSDAFADAPSEGCVFAPRCARFIGDLCERSRPALRPIHITGSPVAHSIACHLAVDALPNAVPTLAPASRPTRTKPG